MKDSRQSFRERDLVPEWSVLKSLGTSRTVRTSFIWIAIVPIAAKLLSKVQDVLPINIGPATIEFTAALPFSWQLFYFSALFFGVGTACFAIRCPPLIKDYESFRDFEEKKRAPRDLLLALHPIVCRNPVWISNSDFIAPYFWMLGFIKEHGGFSTTRDEHGSLINMEQVNMSVLKAGEAEWTYCKSYRILSELVLQDNGMRFAFARAREVSNFCRFWSRFACAFSYAIGVAFLLVVLIQNFRYVFAFLWR
jgi:hypothetical protein